MWTCPADLKTSPLGSKKTLLLGAASHGRLGRRRGLGVLERVREGCTELFGMSTQDKNEAFE